MEIEYQDIYYRILKYLAKNDKFKPVKRQMMILSEMPKYYTKLLRAGLIEKDTLFNTETYRATYQGQFALEPFKQLEKNKQKNFVVIAGIIWFVAGILCFLIWNFIGKEQVCDKIGFSVIVGVIGIIIMLIISGHYFKWVD